MTADLGKDRKDLFPVFARADFASLRQNGLSELRSMIETAETEFLSGEGPFIGSECGLADIHAMWMIKWALKTIGVGNEPGFDQKAYPKVHAWCNSIPTHDDDIQKGQFISAEDASNQILSSNYACTEIGIDRADPLGLQAGEVVAVEMTDATPGTYPQNGRLVGLSKSRVVVELDNGLRLHFPRVGYVVNRTAAENGANGHA